MLRQASDAANLWKAGTPPYHLSAVVHLELGRQKFAGRYDLWWAAPDKYREGFLMPARGGTIVETDLALGNKIYVLRNTPTLSIPLWELRRAMRAVSPTIVGDPVAAIEHLAAVSVHTHVSRVFSAKHAGKKETCVEVKHSIRVHRSLSVTFTVNSLPANGEPATMVKACFKPPSGDIASVTTEPDPGMAVLSLPAAIESGGYVKWRADDFAQADEKRYPKQIEIDDFNMRLAITVTELTHTSKFDSDTFQIPPHSVAWDWCPNPDYNYGNSTINDLTQSQTSVFADNPFQMHIPHQYIAYYVRVGRDGRVSKFVTLSSAGTATDGRIKEWLRRSRYGILSCGGHAIPWEGIVTAPPLFQP